MITSKIQVVNHQPVLFLNQNPVNPTTAYVGPRYVSTFLDAGIKFFTFSVPGIWWSGSGLYDFSEIDEYLQNYIQRIPGAFFMPRINLAPQGYPWWGLANPDEMDVLVDTKSGFPRDPLEPNPAAVPYLGHEVDLNGLNLHSFHSKIWRKHAGQALAALVKHCESMDYANQIWAWHICDGLFCEWFHWHEYSFGALSDYSPAAQADFRGWLRNRYQDDPVVLSRAWGRDVRFDEVEIPIPDERMHITHGEFYDPHQDRAAIDYSICFSQATADSLISICQAVKDALPVPKVTCIFYGYQFSNMPRPQMNGHYALDRVLASPYVDMIASPHSYGNRGEGGFHAPQSLAESIHRAGKIHFDEIDCKTVWTPASVTWKTHISQPKTVKGTIELLKKDAAYALASGTAFWWMDLTDDGWFFNPEAIEPIRKINHIEDQLVGLDRMSVSEIAFVVSQEAMHYLAPHEGLHNAVLKIFRNWHLSRIGAPYDTLLVDELGNPDLPQYKLFIMANLFYLSNDQRRLVDLVVKRNDATALWIYAPGFLDESSASVENMYNLTGIKLGRQDLVAELDVEITRFDHAITQGLPQDFQYGTGIQRQQYLEVPKIQYLPETRVSPSFYVEDESTLILGMVPDTSKPGLAVKELDSWQSIYTTAPVLSWKLMQNIARYAGVHLYVKQGEMIWANRSFLGIYSQDSGRSIIKFPEEKNVFDGYTMEKMGAGVTSIEVEMGLWQTKLLLLK